MTKGYPIFECIPGIPIMDQVNNECTRLLAIHTMRLNHFIAVRPRKMSQDTRKRKDIPKKKNIIVTRGVNKGNKKLSLVELWNTLMCAMSY